MMRKNLSMSIPMLSKDPSEDVTVQLPKFVFGLGHHFYEHCIDEFTRRIKVCSSAIISVILPSLSVSEDDIVDYLCRQHNIITLCMAAKQ